MSVLFGQLQREVNELGESLTQAVRRVLDSGWFILGTEVESFEAEFARWLGVSHAVGVASGTEAITLALKAVGVGAGDEVITAANTCIPTAAGIAATGAQVRLADCDSNTLMILPESVESAITERTKAIVPVHLYGNSADMVKLQNIAQAHGLYLVEDCAQAVGSTSLDQCAGTWGDAGAFSFYPTKNLGAYGDGGCVVTNNPATAQRLRSLRNYGYEERDYSTELGLNSRLDEMQAAVLRTKLPWVETWNQQRKSIAYRYDRGLEGTSARLPNTPEHVGNAYHLYPILVDNRDQVRARLQKLEIQTAVHYPTPLHLQPALAGLGYAKGQFPNAEWACSHVLSLPIFPQLRDDEVERVIVAVNQVLSESRPVPAL